MLAAKVDLLRESGVGLGSLMLALPRHALALTRRSAALSEYAALERDVVPANSLEGSGSPPCALQNVILSCGDASGESHAVRLVRELRSRHPRLQVRGFGGARLATEGMEVWAPLADLNVMGVRDVAKQLPVFVRAVHRFAAEIRRNPPDAVVLVDYPGLNRVLLRVAARRRIPVIDYVAPQLWAWAPWRVRDFRRAQTLLTILPFERDWYRRHGATARFVGHPLGDALAEAGSAEAPEPQELKDSDGPWIGILPGSRRSEVRENLPRMLAAAALVQLRLPEARFVLPHLREELWPMLREHLSASPVKVLLAPGSFHRILPRLTGAWAVSGTASVEVALCGVPTVVVYRIGSRFGAWYARNALTIPHVGAVNLMAGKELLPEVVGLECPPALLADRMLGLLEPGKQAELRASLRRIRNACAPAGAAARAARAIEQGVASFDRTPQAHAR